MRKKRAHNAQVHFSVDTNVEDHCSERWRKQHDLRRFLTRAREFVGTFHFADKPSVHDLPRCDKRFVIPSTSGGVDVVCYN